MTENEISDRVRVRHMTSYCTWNKWNEYYEEFDWCMDFLIDKFIEGDHSVGSFSNWLFD